jgi:hypothetical protein
MFCSAQLGQRLRAHLFKKGGHLGVALEEAMDNFDSTANDGALNHKRRAHSISLVEQVADSLAAVGIHR